MKNVFAKYIREPLLWLGLVLFLNTFFFIAKQAWELGLSLFLTPLPNAFFYFIFAVIFLVWMYFAGRQKPGVLCSREYLTRSLAFFLPAILTLLFGLSLSDQFHFVFQIGAGLILILTLGLLFYDRIKKEPRPTDETVSPKDWFRKQGLPALFVVVFFTGIFFSFATYRLGQYAAVDEPLWLYGRITKFWNNIQEREWEKTDVSDKPGITVAITSGAGLLRYDPRHFDDKRSQGEVFVNKEVSMESFFFTFRFPIVVTVTFLLLFTYFLLERLLGKKTALFAYASLTTSPILIGIAKIINPDALLWIFTTLSLLSYLVFQKRPWYRYLILSGVFLGLALLTKYIANIVFIYLLALLFLEYLYNPAHSQKPLSLYIRQTFFNIGFVVFTALSVFYVLLPANWPEPQVIIESTLLSEAFAKVAPLFIGIVILLLLDQIFNKNRATGFLLNIVSIGKDWLLKIVTLIFFGSLLFTLLNTWQGMKVYDFMELIASPKTISKNSDLIGTFLTNFYPLIFSLTPIALFGLIVALFFTLKKNSYQNDAMRFVWYSLIFTLVYYLGATVNGVGSIIRYQIIIFPLIALASGIGFAGLVSCVESYFPNKKHFALPALLGIWAILSLVVLFKTPFPLSYASELLPKQYYVDLKDMGPGSYEIAHQLNQLPDAKNTLIWTDKDGVCQFFVGRCKRGNGEEAITDQDTDYIVISSARESRTNNMIRSRYDDNPDTVIPIHLFYTLTTPADFNVFINGRPSHYVKAYRYEGQDSLPLLPSP